METPPDCPHPDATGDLGAIAEGICPRCFCPMERADDHGLCPCCGLGWALHGDTVEVSMKALSYDMDTPSGRFHHGPARITVVSNYRAE